MTYKHKLSRRLALSRLAGGAFAVPVVLFATGCGEGELKSGLGPPPPPSGAPQHVTIDSVLYSENGDGTYGVAVHYTPDIGLDSLYVRTRAADGTWQGDVASSPATTPNPQLFTLACSQTNYEIQSRSFRNGLRSDPILRDARTFVCGSPPPPPPPPPPGGTDLALDFDDPNNLGVTCGSSACNWPYRKHDYVPTGGVNGSGAINMHWFTGMSIGFSPVWITVPMTPHFKIRYAARQTATMQSAGSAQKMMRLRSGAGMTIGMLESKNGNFVWDWDNWDVSGTAPKVSIGRPTFNDGQWHIYEIEVDYRNTSAITMTIWFDGVLARTATFNGSAAGNLLNNGPLVISPITEMYSCGPSPCQNSINTGDYTVDDFSFTVLP